VTTGKAACLSACLAARLASSALSSFIRRPISTPAGFVVCQSNAHANAEACANAGAAFPPNVQDGETSADAAQEQGKDDDGIEVDAGDDDGPVFLD